MQVELQIRAEGKPEQKIVINRTVTIGRSKTCQFRVLSNDVSREHCRLIVTENGLAVRDLGSSNGTQLGGKTIPPETDVRVPSGSVVDIGPLKIIATYSGGEAAAKPTEPAAKSAASKSPVAKTSAAKSSTTKPSTADAAPAPAKSKPDVTTKSAASPKKKAKPVEPAAEPALPFDLNATDSNDDSATSDFPIFDSDEASDGPTIDAAAAYEARAAELTQQRVSAAAESDSDDFEEPLFDTSGDSNSEQTSADADAVAPETSAPAVGSQETGSPVVEASAETTVSESDEPVFSTADDDGPGFSFDQLDEPTFESAAPSTGSTDAEVPSSSPATSPAAESKPGKLKSLFGMFGRGKKAEKASSAQNSAVASSASAETPVSGDDQESAEWPAGEIAAASEPDNPLDFLQSNDVEPAPVPAASPAKSKSPAVSSAAVQPAQASGKEAAEAAKQPSPKTAPAKTTAKSKPAPAPAPQEETLPAFDFGGGSSDDDGVDPAFTNFLDQFER